MSTLLHPVGPAGPAVYWRRRAVAAALVVLLVLALLALVGAVSGSADGAAAGGEPGDAPPAGAAGPGAEGTATPDPASTTPPEPGAAVASATVEATAAADGLACDGGAVTVSTGTDAKVYSEGVVPVFTVTVRNDGTQPCVVDLGSGSVQVVVTSGADQVWTSGDCTQGPAERVVTLQPGAQDVMAVPWRRERSAPGCPQDLPPPRPGTYVVTGSLGAQASKGASFVLQ